MLTDRGSDKSELASRCPRAPTVQILLPWDPTPTSPPPPWLYVGSHNFTVSAWGRTDQRLASLGGRGAAPNPRAGPGRVRHLLVAHQRLGGGGTGRGGPGGRVCASGWVLGHQQLRARCRCGPHRSRLDHALCEHNPVLSDGTAVADELVEKAVYCDPYFTETAAWRWLRACSVSEGRWRASSHQPSSGGAIPWSAGQVIVTTC